MSDDEFLTSINPLFTAYELETSIADVWELFQGEGPVAEDTLEDISTQINSIQRSVTRLSDYLEELGIANRNIQNKFGDLVDTIEKRLKGDSGRVAKDSDQPAEKRYPISDTGHEHASQEDADQLSLDEREKLQEHIPSIAEDAEIKQAKMFNEQKAKANKLQGDIIRLVRETFKVTEGVQHTRDGVKVISDGLKEGKKKPTKVILDKPKSDRKRKVLESEKKKDAKSSPSKNASTKRSPNDKQSNTKKLKSADQKVRKDNAQGAFRPSSENDTKQSEKTLEEIEQERYRLQFELERSLRLQKEQEQKAETERRRVEAEERQKKEEEQRRELERQSNTDSWRTLRYEVDGGQLFGNGLGCLVRVESSDMDKDSLVCHVSKLRAESGPLEERVSDVIGLTSHDGNPIHFKYPAVVCIPYHDIPSRKPLVYVREGKGHWSSVGTESSEMDGVPMATFRRRRLKDLIFVVVLAWPSVGQTFDGGGGYLYAAEDPNVKVIIPEGTLKDSIDVDLQVIPKRSVLDALSRIEEKQIIEDVSSLSTVRLLHTTHKHILLETNLVSTDKLSSSRKNVHVMTSADGVTWSCRDPERGKDPERFTTKLDQERESILFLRTRGYVPKDDLEKTAQSLLNRLKEFPTSFLFCQKEAEPHTLHVRCCHKSKLEHIKSSLTDAGYKIDASNTRDLYVRDGTQISLAFSAEGNIDFAEDDASALTITFMSMLEQANTKFDHKIKVKNIFCQKQHSVYRGKLLVSDTSPTPSECDRDRLLCEVPVTLPKSTDDSPRNSKPTHFFYGEEPLSEVYVRTLAGEIADDWVELAYQLGLQGVALQQIKQRHLEQADRAFDMLRTWYMKSKKDGTKVPKLIEALEGVDRVYLAEELTRKNHDIMEERRMRMREQLFAKIAKRISADPRALDNWKGILRTLTLSNDALAQIEGASGNRISCLQSGLAEWLRTTPDKANPTVLMGTLRKMGYHAAAEQVSFCLAK